MTRFRASTPLRSRAAALVLLLSGLTFAGEPDSSLSGRLDVVDGVRVLSLWGSPRESGYAHGYLLSEDIVRLLTACLSDSRLVPSIEAYEKRILQELLPKMTFTADQQEELRGMLEGILAAAGEKGAVIEPLGRTISLNDLFAANSMADWYRLGCSSISAWGAMDKNGEMITARNLDFCPDPEIRDRQIIIVRCQAGEGKLRWISIGWPGSIGCFSCMNEQGVTVSMHDSPGMRPSVATGFVPRSLALREIMERVSAADAIDQAGQILRARPSLSGNNIHVSAPCKGRDIPAAVFEYDGDGALDGGCTMRSPGAKENLTPPGTLACTNHYRTRRPPEECDRYEKLRGALDEAARQNASIDAAAAKRMLQSVAVGGATVHSVIYLPNRRAFEVSFADQTHNAAEGTYHRFDLAQLFEARGKPTAVGSR